LEILQEDLLCQFEFGVLELDLELLVLEFLKLFDFYLFLFRLDLLDLFFLRFDLFDFLLEFLGFFWFGSGRPLRLKYFAAGLSGLD
jgi:hypothetical protein